ncbi:S8 family serine peptidase, partial [Paraburkholderia sp. J41]|uniref:S8 family serine peptidase n=1 Tax=Paraburkholderia sp. J41 TaxID=2805433 RepID=UPI002AC35C3D
EGMAGYSAGWPGQSIVDALNYVNRIMLTRGIYNPKIAAVSISTNGASIAGDLPCATGSIGAQIDQIAGELRAKGIAVVMSAGNDAVNGTGTWTCGSNVIAVGATGVVNPTLPASYSNISQRTSLFAPVGTANRASGDFIFLPYGPGGTGTFWGTSFSAPQVAGAFAVLRQKFGDAPSVASLAQLLKSTGKPLTGPRAGLAATGAVSIDIKAALSGTPPAIK